MVVKKKTDGWSEIFTGVDLQNLAYGERTHMAKFILHTGGSVQLHSHPQEQTGFLIQGKMVMTIDGKEYSLQAGDSWSIAGNVTHGVEVEEECTVIEVFSPLREDYLSKG
jgi:quercetin dioxygenase-like cupin family protein